jgi:hypothetical protein
LKRKRSCSSSTSSDEIILNDSSDTDNNEEAADYENECVGCKEDYRKTKKTEDWIKCTICGRWSTKDVLRIQICANNVENTVARKNIDYKFVIHFSPTLLPSLVHLTYTVEER